MLIQSLVLIVCLPVAGSPKPLPATATPVVAGIKLSIVSVEIAKPVTVKRKKASPEERFLVTVVMLNSNGARKPEYIPWVWHRLARKADKAVLTDDKGNGYKPVTFGIDNYPVGGVSGPVALYPGKPVRDVLVFERPIESARYLDLELPAANLGGKDAVTFRLPRSLWLTPKPAPAPKQAPARTPTPRPTAAVKRPPPVDAPELAPAPRLAVPEPVSNAVITPATLGTTAVIVPVPLARTAAALERYDDDIDGITHPDAAAARAGVDLVKVPTRAFVESERDGMSYLRPTEGPLKGQFRIARSAAVKRIEPDPDAKK